VDYALGDALAVEVLELLDQVEVLQQHGAARTGGDRILVVGNGDAGGGGEVGHGSFLFKLLAIDLFVSIVFVFMNMVELPCDCCKLSIYMTSIEKMD
jgi:hypothetical protein